MSRTELVTEIMKLTGHKRSLHPDVNFGIQRLLDKYDSAKEVGSDEETIEISKKKYDAMIHALKEAQRIILDADEDALGFSVTPKVNDIPTMLSPNKARAKMSISFALNIDKPED